jgi:hypothetical protein
MLDNTTLFKDLILPELEQICDEWLVGTVHKKDGKSVDYFNKGKREGCTIQLDINEDEFVPTKMNEIFIYCVKDNDLDHVKFTFRYKNKQNDEVLKEDNFYLSFYEIKKWTVYDRVRRELNEFLMEELNKDENFKN